MSLAKELLIIVSVVWMTIKVISLMFDISMGDAAAWAVSFGGVLGLLNVFVMSARNSGKGPYVYGKGMLDHFFDEVKQRQ